MLQVKGFIGRYITYTGPDFKEGLSLTVHDEITPWRKYAFGCSELVFNPLKQWWYRCYTPDLAHPPPSSAEPLKYRPVALHS